MNPRFVCLVGALVMSAILPPRTSGAQSTLMALYTFNGTLADASGNAKTASASGTPAYVTGAPFGGQAISFDGSGKSVVTAPLNISVAALKQVTFGAWVRAQSVDSPNYGVISNDDGNFDRSLDIDTRTAKTGANWSAFVGGAVIGKLRAAVGKWVFLAISFNQLSGPGRYAFYVDDGSGMQVLTGTDGFDSDSVTTGVTIGRNPKFDQPFHGEIADAFFYRGILTRAQIEKIIAKGPSALPGYKK